MTVVYGDTKTVDNNFQFRSVVDYTVTANTETTWTVRFKMYGDYRSSNGSHAEAYTTTWFRYWRDASDADNWDSQSAEDLYEPQTTRSTSWTSLTVAYDTVSITKGHSEKTFKLSSEYAYISADPSSVKEVLLTIPAKPSYAVSYNANGGTGVPAAQTKWYGETLTIASSQPTRVGHRFIGWATSSTATSASYSPGSSYTGNAALSLYAVWQKMPVISDIALVRVNSNEVPDEAGGYVKVTVSYQSDYAVTGSSISVDSFSVNTGTFSAGTGTITAVLGNGTSIFPLTAYTATVSMTSQAGTSTGTGSLAASSSYSRPTVSIESLYRVPFASGSGDATTEDDLGRFLYASYTISFTATASQKGLSSVTRRFASLEQSAVIITPYPVPESVIGPVVGFEATWSQQFDYAQIAPGTAHANELTITVSDKFYSATATADLGSGAYFQPRIPSINAVRSDVSGNADDEGKTATVTFDWSVTPSVTQTSPQSVLVSAYDMSDTLIARRTISPSTTSATTVMTFNSSDRAQGAPVVSTDLNDLFDTDQKYVITAELTDLYTSTSKSDILSVAYFTFDVLAGGHGVAFGKPAATAELMDVGYEIHSDADITASGDIKASGDIVAGADGEMEAFNVWARGGGDVYMLEPLGRKHALSKKADESDAISSITRNGTTFTATKADGSTLTFDQDHSSSTLSDIRLTWASSVTTTDWFLARDTAATGTPLFRAITPANARTAMNAVSKSGDTMTGMLTANGHVQAPSSGMSWIGGKTLTNCAFSQTTQTSTSSYHPFLGIKTVGGHVWNIGSLGNSIYMVGFYSSRTANGTDYSHRIDASTGGIYLDASKVFSHKAVLYNNTTGTNGTVTLSTSAANYNHMRIYYRSNDNLYFSVDVYSPSGKYVVLQSMLPRNSTNLYVKVKSILVSGTSISGANPISASDKVTYVERDFNNNTATIQNIYITRVEAWNE